MIKIYSQKWVLLLVLVSMCSARAQVEDLAKAVSEGKVQVSFRGNGGSSGDAVEATLSTTPKGGSNLTLTVPPGTRLISGEAGAQSMANAGVKGRMVSDTSYSDASEIQVSETPATYILDAYCTEFEKDNPSSSTAFSLGKIDPVLSRIFVASDSQVVKQAAVWMYTDHAPFEQVNAKFPLSAAEWKAAAEIVRHAMSAGGKP